MVLVTLGTSNYDFVALGETREHALRTMEEAWEKHRIQTGAVMTWAEVRDDVNMHSIAPGTALRDLSILVAGIRP